MDTAIVYTRNSAESKLPTDVSFENQVADCEKYAAEKGYSILRVLRESHSGADLAGRPLIWEAMEDIRKGRAQVLLVRNYDRLARKPEHQGVILYEVEEVAGGRVEAALEPFDPDDVMARTVRSIMAVVAEAERLNSVARMENGKRYRALRGALPGASNPLYGYAWEDDVEGERTRYMVDPETGPIVQRVFQLAKTGNSIRTIARLLNAEHVPTPSQSHERSGHIGRRQVSEQWSREAVRRIIRERTYMGEGAAYRYTREKGPNGKRTLKVRSEGDAKRVALTVPALVDEDTWTAANTAIGLSPSKGRPPIDKETTWLRGHVYCGVCDSKMHLLHHRDRYKYYCGRRKGVTMGGEPCPGGDFSIESHLLDPDAYEAITAWLGAYRLGVLREKLVARLGLDKVQALVAMAEGYQAQLVEKRAELDTTRRRARQTTNDALAQQFIKDAEELQESITALEAEYAQAREALDRFSSGSAWVDSTLAHIQAGIKDIENPTEADIRALPVEERRLLLSALGLYLKVYPVGYPKRVEAAYHFLLDPVTNEPMQMTQPRARSCYLLIILPDDLVA